VGVLDRSTEVTVGSTKIKLVYGADPRIGDKVISGETVHPFDGGVLANTGVMITVSLDVGLELTWDTGLSLKLTWNTGLCLSLSVWNSLGTQVCLRLSLELIWNRGLCLFFLSGTHLGHRSVSVCLELTWDTSLSVSVWDSPGTAH